MDADNNGMLFILSLTFIESNKDNTNQATKTNRDKSNNQEMNSVSSNSSK